LTGVCGYLFFLVANGNRSHLNVFIITERIGFPPKNKTFKGN
jgi:hypothetical protein